MRAHVAALTEAQAALGTRVGLHTCVVVHVRLQVVLLGEALAAHCARVGLHTAVQAHVQGHVGPATVVEG